MQADEPGNARRRYRELLATYPTMFANQPGGFDILLDDPAMDKAEQQSWEAFRKQRDEDKALAEATPGASSEWFRVGVVFEDAYLTIIRDAVRTPHGDLITYIRIYNRLDKGPGAAILARLNGKLILLRHHRHALRAFLDEAPRGFSRQHESPEETAKRQLREELGAETRHVTLLGQIHPDGGKLGDAVCGVLVDVTSIGSIEHGEAITGYEIVDEKELTRRIANGEITDAFTLSLYAVAVAKKLISAQ